MTRLGLLGLAILLGPGLGSAVAWHAYATSGSAAWRLGAATCAGGVAGGLWALGRIVWRRRVAVNSRA